MANCQFLSRWSVFLFSVIRCKSTASPVASLHPVDSVGKHSEVGGVPKKGGISDNEQEVDIDTRAQLSSTPGRLMRECTHVRECVHTHVHAQRETIKPLMVS